MQNDVNNSRVLVDFTLAAYDGYEIEGQSSVDYLRNNRGSTCVAPYSLRARVGAPISMPILWEDLAKIKPNEINIKNYKKYSKNAWGKFIKNTKKIK